LQCRLAFLWIRYYFLGEFGTKEKVICWK